MLSGRLPINCSDEPSDYSVVHKKLFFELHSPWIAAGCGEGFDQVPSVILIGGSHSRWLLSSYIFFLLHYYCCLYSFILQFSPYVAYCRYTSSIDTDNNGWKYQEAASFLGFTGSHNSSLV